jgi:hypothetical protein
MEPYQHFVFTFVLVILITLVIRFDFLQMLEWALVGAIADSLYDIDHLFWGIARKKIKLKDFLRNPKIALRLRRKTGVLKNIPTHSLPVALLITLLSAMIVPKWAIPIGIGLISHLLTDSYSLKKLNLMPE